VSAQYPTPHDAAPGLWPDAPIIGGACRAGQRQRMEQLQAVWQAEVTAALAACPEHRGIPMALAMYDEGFSTAAQALECIRDALGLPRPVCPSAGECARVTAAWYQGQPPDTASAPTVGG
jgi:hypothetical protein